MRAKYFELGVRLDATPVTLPDGRVIDGNLFRETTHVALYSDTMFPSLADTWRLLNDADAPPSQRGRPPWRRSDAQWPRDPEQYRRDVQRGSRLFPVAGGHGGQHLSLRRLAGRAPQAAGAYHRPRSQRRAAHPEPARSGHPLIGALEMRAALGRRAHGHRRWGAHSLAYFYNGNDCIDGAATAFLVDGALRDTFCPRELRSRPRLRRARVSTSSRAGTIRRYRS